ncbi:UDP-N-acetylmuramyl pentapeptide phosphotransferase [Microbacterium elymi]|jgi:hypothetical protein|uniref:UDP-N-acetylmuramyl pentapeptide phosphotransferase n=1 Tax=Microbacterium elymi TaxID=2909587 RepID=A0ABY5NK63_9MICO|nr:MULTISPECIES: UDP-N-acetylmuramyl pentapeptide phosphotransferase [Microbacterium]UUT35563.1 UDP-N-acetylmuramyl pentapeptide phosphotransferase [Microbacterium elymi]
MSGHVGDTQPRTGAHAVVADALARTGSHPKEEVDPARRPDVLFRVRHEEGEQVSAWWMIGAFVAVSAGVIALLSFIPGGQ